MLEQSVPFEDNGNSHGWVLAKAIDDVSCLVGIYPLEGLAVDHLRSAAQSVVQPELGLLLSGQAGELLLDGLEDADRRQVGLQDDVQLKGRVR